MARISSNPADIFGPIDKFAHSAKVIIIRDILDLDILMPTLVFDYDLKPDIKNGYYMYQNPAGDYITLNMHLINELKDFNDMKTVVTYGLIHEIIHMFQPILSKYKTDKLFYTNIEDSADLITIDIIRQNLEFINSRLNFKFNEVFLTGIERQLTIKNTDMEFNTNFYYSKLIAGVLSSNKLNINFDYLYNLLLNSYMVTVVFKDGRKYHINLYFSILEEIDRLINLIYLEDFNMIYTEIHDFKMDSDNISKHLIIKLF